jgi:hypothetical protein
MSRKGALGQATMEIRQRLMTPAILVALDVPVNTTDAYERE